jgi:hypothetical protein
MIISGEPASWLKTWKRRGIVTSYTDAVIQSLRTFNQLIVEQDLEKARLRNLNDIEV